MKKSRPTAKSMEDASGEEGEDMCDDGGDGGGDDGGDEGEWSGPFNRDILLAD